MTPQEVKDAIRDLGLTQVQLAEVLAVSPQTVRRWITPRDRATARQIDPTAARAIGWFLAGFRPAEWPLQNGRRLRSDTKRGPRG